MSEINNLDTASEEQVEQPKAEKAKVPAQFFQWFDSLRQGYENSINRLFNRVEKVNEDHKEQLKTVYQSQIDGLKKSYQDHLQSLRSSNDSQLEQAQARIKQLEKDAQFYQEQLRHQNQTIDKLNGRYDAVIFALKDKMDNKELENVIKDISPADEQNNQPSLTSHVNDSDHSQEPKTEQQDSPELSQAELRQAELRQAEQETTEQSQAEPKLAEQSHFEQDTELNIEQTMSEAFNARQDKRYEQAYELFYAAAIHGNEKAMGAIGRAHFVGEGVPQEKTVGLAWLIKAAEHQFEPAIKKVSAAQQKSPELYQNALKISTELF